jgi:DNA-binding transcriptional LysR family regulator
LFNRSPRGLTITPEGAEVIERVEKIAAELGDIETQLRGRDQRLEGRVRVALPDMFAVSFLLAGLANFNLEYPGIEIELIHSYHDLDITRREADIAIRPTNNPPENLIGRPLLRFAVAAYGSKRYVTEHDCLVDTSTANWIDWASPGPVPDFVAGLRIDRFGQGSVTIRCDNPLVHHAAVRADLGLAILPCVLADQDKNLVRLPQMEPTPGPMIWLLTHPELRSTQRVHVLSEFIRGEFSKHADQLLGVVQ